MPHGHPQPLRLAHVPHTRLPPEAISPDLSLVADIVDGGLRVRSITHIHVLGVWRLPEGWQALRRSGGPQLSVVAWRPDGGGLAVLAERAGGAAADLQYVDRSADFGLLLAEWPALLVGQGSFCLVEMGSLRLCRLQMLVIVWAPCSAKLALGFCSIGNRAYILTLPSAVEVSFFGYTAAVYDWQWSRDSSVLAGWTHGCLCLFRGHPVHMTVVELAHSASAPVWAPQHPTLILAGEEGLSTLDCATAQPEQVLQLPLDQSSDCTPELAAGTSQLAVRRHCPLLDEVLLLRVSSGGLVPAGHVLCHSTVGLGGMLSLSLDEQHLALALDDPVSTTWQLCIFRLPDLESLVDTAVPVRAPFKDLVGIRWAPGGHQLCLVAGHRSRAHALSRYDWPGQLLLITFK